jgi:hypothetical protein
VEGASRKPVGEDFAAAAAPAQPFMIYQVLLRFRVPPTEGQWMHADPVLKLLPRAPTLWLVPLLGGALTIAWLVMAWPSRAVFARSVVAAAAGALLSFGLMKLSLKYNGPYLPTSIRLEEWEGTGVSLGLLTGYFEEMLLRVGVLPLAFFFFSERSRWVAVVGASVLTAIAFALLHEPGSPSWSATLFLVRFIVPGVGLSLLALVTKPSLAIVAHCTAHVLIPIHFG